MLAGVARALVTRGGPRVARPARQLRSSAPLRMAASTLEGLRNVAIVAHVRRSVRKQCRVKRVHSPRRRANAAPDARPQQRNVQPYAVEHTTSVPHAGRPRQDDFSGCPPPGVERV